MLKEDVSWNINHPLQDCVDDFDPIKAGKLRLSSSGSDMTPTLHFGTDPTLVKINHVRRSLVLSGTVQGADHFSSHLSISIRVIEKK